jgi:3-dehydroquinate dehydratase-2
LSYAGQGVARNATPVRPPPIQRRDQAPSGGAHDADTTEFIASIVAEITKGRLVRHDEVADLCARAARSACRFTTGFVFEISDGRDVLMMRAGLPLSQARLTETSMARRVFILNGPNLNLLGKRQPHIYGSTTLTDVENAVRELADTFKLEVRFHQSNREYEIIDLIHEARETSVGLAINPGAFTHTSIAILDALNTYDHPVIEVHISQVHKREAFRHHSYVSHRADAVMAGFGTHGYELAVRHLAHLIDGKTANL